MIIAVIAALTLGACTKQDYATNEVTVLTAAGPVTCQLYTRGTVLWDEATSHPLSMAPHEADEVCRRAGVELMNEMY
jgi:hypothetical protein